MESNSLGKFKLDGKVALVSGASRGLGESMAVALAQAGADVGIIGRDEAMLAGVAKQINSVGRDCLQIPVDLSESGSCQKAVGQLLKWKGTIDILCNNAATIVRVPAEKLTEDEWDSLMDLNLKAVFFLAQAAGRVMIEKRRGKIINIGSLHSIISGPNLVAYAASKGGVLQVTKALAVEWAKFNIQVNCIIPGFYNTDLTKQVRSDPDRSAAVLKRVPMGRWGDPSDVQGAVVFLASGASDFVTGIALPVDGGYLAS